MTSSITNLAMALGLVVIGIAIGISGIYIGDTDDAPGASLLGILLMIGFVTLGARIARRKHGTMAPPPATMPIGTAPRPGSRQTGPLAVWTWSRWRLLPWGIAAFLLLLPAVAMRYSDEVAWGPEDFLIIGTLLAMVCGAIELAARATTSFFYRAGVCLAVVTAFLLFWINAAVGMIGDEGNPANLIYAGVLLVALAGALLGRFRPAGMTRAFLATAGVHMLVALVALIAGLGANEPPGPVGILILNGFFVALWTLAASLFHLAAREV